MADGNFNITFTGYKILRNSPLFDGVFEQEFTGVLVFGDYRGRGIWVTIPMPEDLLDDEEFKDKIESFARETVEALDARKIPGYDPTR